MVTPTQPEDAVAKAHIFSLEDLEVNRVGRLSDRQKSMLSIRLAGWLGLAGLYIVILVLFIYFQVVSQGNLLLGLAGILFLMILISSCLNEASPLREDLQRDVVKTASGQLHKGYGVAHGSTRHSYVAHYHIRIQNQLFSITPMIYDHVNEDESYRIYYVEGTRTIVNVEPL